MLNTATKLTVYCVVPHALCNPYQLANRFLPQSRANRFAKKADEQAARLPGPADYSPKASPTRPQKRGHDAVSHLVWVQVDHGGAMCLGMPEHALQRV